MTGITFPDEQALLAFLIHIMLKHAVCPVREVRKLFRWGSSRFDVPFPKLIISKFLKIPWPRIVAQTVNILLISVKLAWLFWLKILVVPFLLQKVVNSTLTDFLLILSCLIPMFWIFNKIDGMECVKNHIDSYDLSLNGQWLHTRHQRLSLITVWVYEELWTFR